MRPQATADRQGSHLPDQNPARAFHADAVMFVVTLPLDLAGISKVPAYSVVVFPGFHAFPDRQDGDDERCGRVGPPPAEPRVEAEADQRGSRGESAEGGFGGVGYEGAVAQGLSGAAF